MVILLIGVALYLVAFRAIYRSSILDPTVFPPSVLRRIRFANRGAVPLAVGAGLLAGVLLRGEPWW